MFRPFLTFTIVLSATSVLAAEETKTWRGTWRNKRYNPLVRSVAQQPLPMVEKLGPPSLRGCSNARNSATT